jgi:hypothetical protein
LRKGVRIFKLRTVTVEDHYAWVMRKDAAGGSKLLHSLKPRLERAEGVDENTFFP